MGGLGSGRGSRPNAWRCKKLYMGRLPGLNIPELIKLHKANPTNTFTFKDIKLTVGESSIHLEKAGENLPTNTIEISAMSCHFGGNRFFGCCASCQRRVVTLYLHKILFACRKCFRMVYFSQNTTFSYRLIMKRRKVEKKLNNDKWEKPFWMREKTFKKLRSEYFDLDEKEQIADFFSLRNYKAVNEIFDKYGLAVIAAECWLMHHYS